MESAHPVRWGSASAVSMNALAGAVPVVMTVSDAAYIRPYGVDFYNAVRCELGARRGFGRGGDRVRRAPYNGCILTNSLTHHT